MENGCFSGRLRPDLGNTTRAAMAALGSVGCAGSVAHAVLQCFFTTVQPA